MRHFPLRSSAMDPTRPAPLFLFASRCVVDIWPWRRLWPLARTSLRPSALTPSPYLCRFLTAAWISNGAIPITGATAATRFRHSVTTIRLGLFWAFSKRYRSFCPTGPAHSREQSWCSATRFNRSGLFDLGLRFSANLKGGPAMSVQDFVDWKQKTLLGASLTVIAPTGQYNPTRLLNWGINRWAFKPELGYSRRWRNWVLDAYGGAWFYTTNQASFSLPHPQPQTKSPVGSFEGHLSYDFKSRCWASLDGNFWFGRQHQIERRSQIPELARRVSAWGRPPRFG